MSNIDVLNHIVLLLAKCWMVAALALFLVARSRNTSAATLHALLLSVLLGLACLPLLQIFLPGFYLKIMPEDFAQTQVPRSTLVGVFVGYIAVVMVLWANLLRHFFILRHLHQNASPFSSAAHQQLLQEVRQSSGVSRPVELAYSEKITTPMTFGWRNPKILLPLASQQWDTNRLRRFLLHELAHVKRGDWLAKLLGRILVHSFWLIPGVWMLLKKIEWFAELACDDAVICSEGGRAEYADDLLEMTACGHTVFGAAALIENHGHYARIAAVLDGGRIRASDANKFWPYALVFCGLLILFSSVRLAPSTIAPVTSYNLLPLVMLAGLEPETPALSSDGITPSPPEKLVYPDTPLALPRPVLEMPPPEQIRAEPEPITASVELPPTFAVLDISASLRPLQMPLPEYPKRALRKQVEGRVVARFDVLPDGTVEAVTILEAEPAVYFDQAVLAAVKKFRYAPQSAVVAGVTEIFEFKLLEDALPNSAAQK